MPRQLKAPEQRRNNHPPVSEWVVLPVEFEAVLPAYPPEWRERALLAQVDPTIVEPVREDMWEAWREDSVTTQWSRADIAQALEMGRVYGALPWPERRMLKDRLGLNAAARRTLRWRTQVEADKQMEALERVAEIKRLRVVARQAEKKETA